MRDTIGADKKSAEALYQTKDADVSVPYQVDLAYRIADLEKIKSKLDQQQDIRAHIKDVLRAEAQFFTRAKTAEDFYLRFSRGMDETGASRDGFEDELSKLLKGKLESEFFASDITVRVFPHASEITDLYRNLTSFASRQIEFTFLPVPDYDGEVTAHPDYGPVTCRFHLNVTGMAGPEDTKPSGWNRFQTFDWKNEQERLKRAQPPEQAALVGPIDLVLGAVQEGLPRRMQTALFSKVRFRDEAERKEFAEIVRKHVDDIVRDEFGLTVRISNLSRDQTGIEKQLIEQKRIEELQRQLTITHAIGQQETQLKQLQLHQDRIAAEQSDREERLKLLRKKRSEMMEKDTFYPEDDDYKKLCAEIDSLNSGLDPTGDQDYINKVEAGIAKDRLAILDLISSGASPESDEVKKLRARMAFYERELDARGRRRIGVMAPDQALALPGRQAAGSGQQPRLAHNGPTSPEVET